MSEWTHSICDKCWKQRHPDRNPFRLADEFRDTRKCCFCGLDHHSGILIMENPKKLKHCNFGKDHK